MSKATDNPVTTNSGEGPSELKLTKQIVWRLPVVMAERGIYKRNKLQKMLKDIGIEMSTVQVGRIFNEPPDSYKKNLLEGLMTVLNCQLSDLMRVVDVTPDGQIIEPQKEPSAKPVAAPAAPVTPVVPLRQTTEPAQKKTVVAAGVERPRTSKTIVPDDEQLPSIANKLQNYEPGKGIRVGSLPRPIPKIEE